MPEPLPPSEGRKSCDIERRPRRKRLSAWQCLSQAQRMDCVAALASGLVHDLNNVFAPIVVSAELLRQKSPEGEARQCLDIVLRSAKEGSATLRSALAIAGAMENDLVELDAGPVLDAIRASLRSLFSDRVEIDGNSPAGARRIWADPSQIREAIMNLALFVADSMPHGGLLEISASNANVTGDMVHGRPGASRGPHLLITIAGTGRGMPAADVDRVFDPYFATQDSIHIDGLGLAVVYGIVKCHGGFIRVHSEANCGTEFEILLPALRGALKP